MKLWCLFMLVLAGCKPSSYDEFATQVTTASCDRAIVCGQVGAAEREKCPAPAAFAITEPPGRDVRGGIANHLMELDGQGAQDCIDATTRASCEPPLAATEVALYCHNVVRPSVPVGGGCSGAGQCVGSACDNGRCLAYPPPGSFCMPVGGPVSQTCDPTVQFCGGFTNDGGVAAIACQRRKQQGEECAIANECAFGHDCFDGICMFRPQARRDEPCGGLPCEICNFCSPRGICERWRKKEQSCETPFACEPGLACIGLDGATPGVCAPWLDKNAACTATGITGCPATQQCTNGVCG